MLPIVAASLSPSTSELCPLLAPVNHPVEIVLAYTGVDETGCITVVGDDHKNIRATAENGCFNQFFPSIYLLPHVNEIIAELVYISTGIRSHTEQNISSRAFVPATLHKVFRCIRICNSLTTNSERESEG